MSQKAKELIKNILDNGTAQEKRALFSFTVEESNEVILKKFELFTRYNFSRYFTHPSAPYHSDIVMDYIDSYKGISSVLEAAHRDAAKTALVKLFVTFVILNDKESFRKYIKINSKELTNSKQITTDVYNMMVELIPTYGDPFEVEEGNSKAKREETQGSFTTKNQVKVKSGTVGQDQRGALQDAYRPDWQIFEDIEDSTSVTSQLVTLANKKRIQEAIDGRAHGSKYIVNCNYISEDANIQWLMDKKSVRERIMPIATECAYGRDEEGKATLTAGMAVWDKKFSFEDLKERYDDSLDWFGEFMCDPSRTANKFFDIDLINFQLKNIAKPFTRKVGLTQYWEEYSPSKRYGIGSDHSEGIGLDANTAVVFNFVTGETVATHADNELSPDLAAYEYARVGNEFGNCIWAPEVNNKCGGIVITTAKDIGYQNLYQKEVKDNVGNVLTKKLGWETNGKTKNTMIVDFRRDFNDGLIKILDERILREMKAFTNNDLVDSTVGLTTRHFDLFMATCIAWQMKNNTSSSQSTKDFYANLKGSTSSRGARG
jgi:hypothetical protein